MSTISILRRPEVQARLGLPRASLRDEINRGVVTPPLPLGERSVGWPSCEIDQIVSAIIGGWSLEQRQSLVKRLLAERQAHRA